MVRTFTNLFICPLIGKPIKGVAYGLNAYLNLDKTGKPNQVFIETEFKTDMGVPIIDVPYHLKTHYLHIFNLSDLDTYDYMYEDILSIYYGEYKNLSIEGISIIKASGIEQMNINLLKLINSPLLENYMTILKNEYNITVDNNTYLPPLCDKVNGKYVLRYIESAYNRIHDPERFIQGMNQVQKDREIEKRLIQESYKLSSG